MSFEDDVAYLQLNSVSFSIETNEHRTYYQSMRHFLEHDEHGSRLELSDVERVKCIEGDEIAVVQVYPDTPVGFFVVASYNIPDACRQAAQALRRHREGAPATDVGQGMPR